MNITIVGGGFGGIKAALELAEDASNKITLITDKPDFQYYPALYSAATGHSHLESWVPLGTIFSGKHNIHVHIDSIVSIDPKAKTLTGNSGVVYGFDRCILALGTVTTYFGIKGLETYAYGIKSAAEIKRLKQHIYVDIAENHTTDKHYIIVGAGPTGVELAAALGSYLARMCEHYGVKNPKLQIDLIEAAPRVLPRMSEKASKKVQKRLESLGVNVQTGKTVESASEEDLMVSGNSIDSRTVIWTSGVANHPFYKNNEAHFEFAKNGRIVVDEYMQAAKNIYVIGDNAATQYTGLAQTALHDALFVADNLKRQAKHKTLKKYKAVMPPVVVPVGENWAVFEWRGLRLYGWVASLLRRAADFIGYNDMLPLGQALGVWRASTIMEDDYFTPTPTQK
jgi:NADH dehydrogenase